MCNKFFKICFVTVKSDHVYSVVLNQSFTGLCTWLIVKHIKSRNKDTQYNGGTIYVEHTMGLIFYNQVFLCVSETIIGKSMFEIFTRHYGIKIKHINGEKIIFMQKNLNMTAKKRVRHFTLEVPACIIRMQWRMRIYKQ